MAFKSLENEIGWIEDLEDINGTRVVGVADEAYSPANRMGKDIWENTLDNETRVTSLENSIGGGSGPSFLNQQVFLYDGSLIIPSNIDRIKVTGTGGGGGGSASHEQGGGAGGTFSQIIIVSPGDVVSFTIGIAGIAGIASGQETNGGDTTITITNHTGSVVAQGGRHGANGSPTVGVGGTSSSTISNSVSNSLIAMTGGHGAGDGSTGSEGGDAFYGVGGAESFVGLPKYGGGGGQNRDGASGIVVIEYNESLINTDHEVRITTLENAPQPSGKLYIYTSQTVQIPIGARVHISGIGGGSSGTVNVNDIPGNNTIVTNNNKTYTAGGASLALGGAAGIGGFSGGVGVGGDNAGGAAGTGGAGVDGVSGSSGGASDGPGVNGAHISGGFGETTDPTRDHINPQNFPGGGGQSASTGIGSGGSGGGSFHTSFIVIDASFIITVGAGGVGVAGEGSSGGNGLVIIEW